MKRKKTSITLQFDKKGIEIIDEILNTKFLKWKKQTKKKKKLNI